MIAVIVTVALFGLANLGTLVFFLGGLKQRVLQLEEWADRMGPKILDTRERLASLEGQMKSEPAR